MISSFNHMENYHYSKYIIERRVTLRNILRYIGINISLNMKESYSLIYYHQIYLQNEISLKLMITINIKSFYLS